jgi:hypothetical protein
MQAPQGSAVWPTSFSPKRYAVGGMHRKGLTRKVSVLLYFSHPVMKPEGRVLSESNLFVFHGMLCKAQNLCCQ